MRSPTPLKRQSLLALFVSALLFGTVPSMIMPAYSYPSYGSAVELHQGPATPAQPTNFTQLVQAFDNLTAQYTALNQRYLQLVASFNQLNGSQQSLAQSYARLASLYANQSKAYAELASSYQNQTKFISTLSSSFQSLSVALSQSFSGLSANYDQLSTSYGQLSTNYDRQSNQLAEYQDFTYLLAAALVAVAFVSLWLLRRRPAVPRS